MEGKTTYAEIEARDLYWLLDLNEAIDVWRDVNDLDVSPPVPRSTEGTSLVRFIV